MSIPSLKQCFLFFAGAPTVASAPKFTAKPVIKQVTGGVLFEVRVQSDSAPEVTWYKGDTVVEHGGRFKTTIQADGNNYILQLEISSLTPDDGGLYKVTAKNAHGTSNASLNLNLEG